MQGPIIVADFRLPTGNAANTARRPQLLLRNLPMLAVSPLADLVPCAEVERLVGDVVVDRVSFEDLTAVEGVAPLALLLDHVLEAAEGATSEVRVEVTRVFESGEEGEADVV